MRVLCSMMLATASAVGCGGDQPAQSGATAPLVPAAATSVEPTAEVDLDSLPAPARSTELLRRAEAAAAAGRWQEAARYYSATWEHEFPVDAFFTSLEKSRSKAMAEASRDDALNQRIYIEALRERTRRLAACPDPFPNDIPGEYMVHRLLTEEETGNPEQELSAADPWQVATQLWAVRRGDAELEPVRAAELAVARYRERPDLWTEAVTAQLWLLAAESDLIDVSAGWPEAIRPSWRRAPAGGGLLAVEVRQWGGGMLHTLPGSTGLYIDDEPASPGWSGRPEPRELTPGAHVIRFLDGHLHSQKVVVEVEPGRCAVLVLVAIAGV